MSIDLNLEPLEATLGAGALIVNDYRITTEPIDGGHRLTVTRGSEVQTMDLLDGAQGKPGPQGEKGDKGEPGPAGPQGEPGQDAPQESVLYTPQTLTTEQQAQARENIGAADAITVNGLKGDKLDKPAAPPAAAGKVLRVLSVNEDGTFTCEWADAPSSGVTDVMLYGRSIVVGGMAEIPIATGNNNQFGAMRVESNYTGISVNNNGQLSIAQAYIAHINGRNSVKPITPPILDISVKAAMCDGKGAAWTDTERIAALLRMGCTVDDNGFVKWGASE